MKIILYTKTNCPWCKEVLEFLNKNKLPFEEREVLHTPKNFEEMIAKSGQTKAPTLDIDGEILADSDAGQVEEFLRKKGAVK